MWNSLPMTKRETPMQPQTPIHPDDACRTCRGTGWQTYPSSDRYGDARTLTEPCMSCGGSGAK